MPRVVVLALIVIVAASIECNAQKNIQQADTTKYWRVETNDDNEFIGKIKGVENGVLTLQTEKFGTLTIRMIDIKSMEEADPGKMIGSDYWSDNFQSTRYFWMPNGYGLKAGEAYYQNVWILFNQFSVGITKNLSVSAGTIPIFLFGADVLPYWLNAKVSLPLSEKLHFGAGVLYVSALDFGDDFDAGGAGVAYGLMTFGSRDHNASVGLGYGFSGRDFSRRPVVTLAGMTRLGPRSYLMTENYIFGVGSASGSFGLISVGGRRLIKKVGLDFGGFIPIEEGLNRTIVIPWLGFSMPLGKGGSGR